MAATEDNTYNFNQTTMGSIRVRVRRYADFNVEDLVETRAQGLAAALRLEHRRAKLAEGDGSLQGITFISELPE